MNLKKKHRFNLGKPHTRKELIKKAYEAAKAVTRITGLLDVNRKKHETDDLLLLLCEDWYPRILSASRRGMYACPLEFHLFTDVVESDAYELALRKCDTEERIREFFEETGFSVLKFESWKLERDAVYVMFYVSWG